VGTGFLITVVLRELDEEDEEELEFVLAGFLFSGIGPLLETVDVLGTVVVDLTT